jgi:hypothetical protein
MCTVTSCGWDVLTNVKLANARVSVSLFTVVGFGLKKSGLPPQRIIRAGRKEGLMEMVYDEWAIDTMIVWS